MDFMELTRLAGGHVEARIVQAAVQLGVFDCLRGASAGVSQIAASLGTDLRATELLLNSLVALRLLSKEGDNFSLLPIAATYLVSNSPQSLAGMIHFETSLWNCWEQLPEAIRNGAPVRVPDMYQSDREETERFIGAMDSLVKARGDADLVATHLDWQRLTHWLDIGSGPATYPIKLCNRYPNLYATIFDLPGTLRLTKRFVADAQLQNRIRLIAGNYRTDPIPGAYDLIFMSNIIHGESYEENEKLVAKLSSNLHPGGKIVIKDHVLDDSRAHPAVGAVFSLLMLLTTQTGRCYTFNEIRSWLVRAGLRQVSEIQLPPPLTSSLVVGQR